MICEEKLKSYLSGIEDLKKSPLFPIGMIIIDGNDDSAREDVLKIIKTQKMKVIDLDNDVHPDSILKNLIGLIEKGDGAVLNVKKEIPPKIFDQLSNLSHDQINVQLAGEKEPKILNPVPKGGFVILLADNGYYQNSIMGDIILSFCNLARY